MSIIASVNSNTCHSGPAANVICPLTVVLSAISSAPVSVQYATEAGTASAGAGDYQGVSPDQHATVTIPPGSTCGQIQITIKPHAPGGSKFFTVRLANPVGASIDQPAGAGVITIVPDGVVPIPPHGPIDLAPIIAAQNGPLTLPAGGHYKTTAIIEMKYPLDGSGSLVDLPQGTTNFKAVAPNVTLANFTAYKGGLFFEAAADNCSVTGCNIGVGQPPGSFTAAFKTLPGGTNAKFKGNHVGVTTSVSVYCDQDGAQVGGPNASDSNTLMGSVNEYALRCEVGGEDGKTIPNGALVQKNIISNGTRKDAIGVRAFHNVLLLDNVINGDARYGQVPGAGSPAPVVGQYCTGTISGNHFTSNGMLISLCEIYQGSKLTMTANVFTNPIAPAVSADSYSEVTTQNNTIQIYAGSHPWSFWAISSKGKQIDLGGNKTVTIPHA